MISSLIPFFSAHSDKFRALWGGFPPKETGNPEDFAENRLQEVLPGGIFAELYFDYVNRCVLTHNSVTKHPHCVRGTVL